MVWGWAPPKVSKTPRFCHILMHNLVFFLFRVPPPPPLHHKSVKQTKSVHRNCRSADPYIARGFIANIKIQWFHNHHLISADSLQRRDVSESVKNKIIHLYKEGATPTGAHYQIQQELEASLSPSDYVLVSADRHVMPDKQYCHR